MSRKIFRELVSVEEARGIFYKHAPITPIGTIKLPLIEALGYVLAVDVFSPINVPPFDRSAMDGFALLANDTLGSTESSAVKIDVVGEIKAGYVFEGVIQSGECVEISTGAPLPTGADSVVMVEYTERKGDSVEIYKAAAPGQNIMSAGADIQEGELIVRKGSQLTSRELAVLGAIGISKIEVIKKPKVGIFSSGDEVISANQELQPGKLYDINSIAISAGVIENGGIPTFLGIIEDEYTTLETKLSENLKLFDILIISGGTSAGMGDMLFEVVDNIGDPGLLVHGIKVKPGKPTILAVCDGTPVIGLPGYPASALSIFQLFVVPYVRLLSGLGSIEAKTKITARIKQRLRSVMGRHEFKPMNLIRSDEGWLAFPVPGGSGAITSIALADGFVEIGENQAFVLADSEVEINLFSEKIKPTDIQIIGSHCSVLAKIIQLYSQKYPNYHIRSIGVGSSGGIAAIRRGEAHVAGIHLLTEKGYNQFGENDVDGTVVEGYNRMQGMVVLKGNPKKINSIHDLAKKEITFINRNPGSGTRALFDNLLNEEGIESENINGYNQYTKSHSSVANAVKSGLVDVGLAIESVVDMELEFIPIREEKYDFLIKNQYISLEPVQAFVQLLQSDEVRNIVSKFKGYSNRKL